MKHLTTIFIRPLLFCLVFLIAGSISLYAQVSISPAQGSFTLSKHEDFSTDDRFFSREDVLFMRIDAPAIDFLGLSVNEYHLAPVGLDDANLAGFHGSLDNSFDGLYTAKVDLSQIPENVSPTWVWSARLEDDKGNEYKAEAEVIIGDPNDGLEIAVKGVLEEVGEGLIVLYGRHIQVSDQTEIVTEEGEALRLGDLEAGDEVSVVILIEPATDPAGVELLALRIVRFNDDRKEEVVVTGVIQELGDRAFVVQNLVFEVSDDTRILDSNEEEIGYADLQEGLVVTVIGQYTAEGNLHAILVIVQGDDRGEFTLEGVISQVVDRGVIVQETLFLLTENTVILNADGEVVSSDFLKEGQLVVIRAQLGENGLPTAISIKIVENINGEVFAKGIIEQLFDEGLVVQGRKFLVTANTRIVDENGVAISFSGLREGQIVTVIGHYTDTGDLLALLITLESEIQDEVEVEGIILAKREGGIVVQDLFFAVTDVTVITSETGEALRYEDLATGQFVQVTGKRSDTGMLYATKISVESREIVVDGPIERIDGVNFYVGGFHFRVNDTTEIFNANGEPIRMESLHVGAVVLVEGVMLPITDNASDLAEVYLARKILVMDDVREKIVVTGVVHEVGDVRFVVGDHSFILSSETVFKNEIGERIDGVGLEKGMVVEVTAIVGEDGQLTAICIRFKARFQEKVSGKIEKIEGNTVVIAGVEFLVTENTEIFSVQGQPLRLDALKVGMLARAMLTKLDSGELAATRMRVLLRIEDEVWVTGVVEALLDKSLVILGRTFYVTPHTVIVDELGQAMRLESIPVGRTVRVRADLLPGDGLVALHITLLNEQVKDIHVVGPIEDIEANTVAVMGIYFFTGTDTRMFDVDGQEVALNQFEVGQTVEIFAIGQTDGTRQATLIRAQDVVVAAGAITSLSGTEISLLGNSYTFDAAALVLGETNDHISLTDLRVGQYAEIRGITTNQAGKNASPSTVTKIKLLNAEGSVSIAVEDPLEAQPESFVLHQNYPNPFNPTTTISFGLNEAAPVTLTVYTLLGQEVSILVRGALAAGLHTVEWSGRDHAGKPAASGVYLYRLQVGQDVQTRRMVLLK